MFFNSIKEINRLLSKGMSNIYLNLTIEKDWRYQNQRSFTRGVRTNYREWQRVVQRVTTSDKEW